MNINFKINNVPFKLKTIGKHNMENALAAATVAYTIGYSFGNICRSIKKL